MLLGNKEQTIRLHAENFLWGNLAFDYGLTDDERFSLASASGDLDKVFVKWLKEEEVKNNSDEHTKLTENLYYIILGWHIRGRLKGKLVDVDLELENKKLIDENMRLKLQNDQYKKDVIVALTELRDKKDLVETYEKTFGIKKP